MCFAPRAGGDGPRVTRIPGEVSVRRPVLQHICALKSHDFELEALRILEELNGDTLPSDRRVVPVRQRQAAGNEPQVRVLRHLVPAGAAQQQPRTAPSEPNPAAPQRHDTQRRGELHQKHPERKQNNTRFPPLTDEAACNERSTKEHVLQV